MSPASRTLPSWGWMSTWHHVSTKPVEAGGRGPKELTGMVDLTHRRDSKGRLRPQARLLDLIPGRSGATYKNCAA